MSFVCETLIEVEISLVIRDLLPVLQTLHSGVSAYRGESRNRGFVEHARGIASVDRCGGFLDGFPLIDAFHLRVDYFRRSLSAPFTLNVAEVVAHNGVGNGLVV